MSKVYQPIVIESCEAMLENLSVGRFFEEYEIKNLTFAREKLLSSINEKYVEELISSVENDSDQWFTDVEWVQILREIVAGSVLYDLRDKGYVESFDDGENEEVFFLTDEGRKELKKRT